MGKIKLSGISLLEMLGEVDDDLFSCGHAEDDFIKTKQTKTKRKKHIEGSRLQKGEKIMKITGIAAACTAAGTLLAATLLPAVFRQQEGLPLRPAGISEQESKEAATEIEEFSSAMTPTMDLTVLTEITYRGDAYQFDGYICEPAGLVPVPEEEKGEFDGVLMSQNWGEEGLTEIPLTGSDFSVYTLEGKSQFIVLYYQNNWFLYRHAEIPADDTEPAPFEEETAQEADPRILEEREDGVVLQETVENGDTVTVMLDPEGNELWREASGMRYNGSCGEYFNWIDSNGYSVITDSHLMMLINSSEFVMVNSDVIPDFASATEYRVIDTEQYDNIGRSLLTVEMYSPLKDKRAQILCDERFIALNRVYARVTLPLEEYEEGKYSDGIGADIYCPEGRILHAGVSWRNRMSEEEALSLKEGDRLLLTLKRYSLPDPDDTSPSVTLVSPFRIEVVKADAEGETAGLPAIDPGFVSMRYGLFEENQAAVADPEAAAQFAEFLEAIPLVKATPDEVLAFAGGEMSGIGSGRFTLFEYADHMAGIGMYAGYPGTAGDEGFLYYAADTNGPTADLYRLQYEEDYDLIRKATELAAVNMSVTNSEDTVGVELPEDADYMVYYSYTMGNLTIPLTSGNTQPLFYDCFNATTLPLYPASEKDWEDWEAIRSSRPEMWREFRIGVGDVVLEMSKNYLLVHTGTTYRPSADRGQLYRFVYAEELSMLKKMIWRVIWRIRVEGRTGEAIEFGHYEQDGNTDNGPEPIVWRVLADDNGKLLMISEEGLDAKPYNENMPGITNITWEECSLRKWLNEDFYREAFTEEEQSHIRLTHVINEDNLDYGTEGGKNTGDKVFLLSIKEAEKYFESDESRMVFATPFAKTVGEWGGAWVSELTGTSWWWLRSPGSNNPISTAIVKDDGSVYSFGSMYSYANGVVRPALVISADWVQ